MHKKYLSQSRRWNFKCKWWWHLKYLSLSPFLSKAIGRYRGWAQRYPIRFCAIRSPWLAGLHLHTTDGADDATDRREAAIPQHRARSAGWDICGEVGLTTKHCAKKCPSIVVAIRIFKWKKIYLSFLFCDPCNLNYFAILPLKLICKQPPIWCRHKCMLQCHILNSYFGCLFHFKGSKDMLL